MSEGAPYQEDDVSHLAAEIFSGNLSLGEALAKLRTRLLDLSMRNRLLNYRHPKGRSFQFSDDPDLDYIYERLQDGGSVSLGHVPSPPSSRYEAGKKPDVRTYAREVGIGTSFDLRSPAPGEGPRASSSLQVLMYPEDLEKAARKVATEARTVVEETGTNMLYLVFGFLEYFDSDESDKPVHAPLLAMPVSLEKGRIDQDARTYLYDLRHTGEDITENFTLREKLRQHFKLAMPELEEADTPEVYFDRIQKAVATRRNWVVRRRLTLCFLSFGKLAIWADLDPEKSPALLQSDLLKQVFQGGRSSDTVGLHAEDYNVDAHPDADLPLIYDADPSQHSALIDVKGGKSLVINGPPGTGKSQTITNIIATAMSEGRKVLFVSEKLAALEVVKHRLEKAGLGDFCLELHSHKTQKKAMLDSIGQRMRRQYSKVSGYEQKVERLRERRAHLNAYAELLGSQVCNGLGLTVHQLFWMAERYRQALGDDAESLAGLVLPATDAWTPADVDRRRSILADAATALLEMGGLPHESPWRGFQPGLLVKGDEIAVGQVVVQALQHAQTTVTQTDHLQALVPGPVWATDRVHAARTALKGLLDFGPLPDGQLLGRMYPTGMSGHGHAAAEVRRLTVMLAQARDAAARAARGVRSGVSVDAAALGPQAGTARRVLSDQAVLSAWEQLAPAGIQLRAMLGRVCKAGEGRDALVPKAALQLLKRLRGWSVSAEHEPLMGITAAELSSRSQAAATHLAAVRLDLRDVMQVLRTADLPFNGRVAELRELLSGAGLVELLPPTPQTEAADEQLRHAAGSGWGDWTVARLRALDQELGELVAAATEAEGQLQEFLTRLSLPSETSRTALQSLEVLVGIAEQAPRELLMHRGPGLDRPDFVEVALRAEETARSLQAKAAKVAHVFDLDALPDDDEMRAYVKVFRRGDSIFNVLKADWRAAKAAFQRSLNSPKKVTATAMAEQFAAVLKWRASQATFESSDNCRSVLGPLFQGVKTDFERIRRLHSWVQRSQDQLLATDYALNLHANTVPEAILTLLATNAARIRNWIDKLQSLLRALKDRQGLDPSLAQARRLQEVLAPLDLYRQQVRAIADALQVSATPTTSVRRAIDLLNLRRRILAHAEPIRRLTDAPQELARLGAALGLPASPLSCEDLPGGVAAVAARSQAARDIADAVAVGVGADFTGHDAVQLVEAWVEFDAGALGWLSSSGVPIQGPLETVLQHRSEQIDALDQVTRYLSAWAQPGIAVKDAFAAAQAQLDAALFLANIESDRSFVQTFGDAVRGLATDEAPLARAMQWGEAVRATAVALPAAVLDSLLRPDAHELLPALEVAARTAADADRQCREALNRLGQWGTLDPMAWGGGSTPLDTLARLERARDGVDVLVPWSRFLTAKSDAGAQGLGNLLAMAETGQIAPQRVADAFQFVLYRGLSRGVLQKHPTLARFTGPNHDRLREEFGQLDRELIQATGAMFAARIDAAKRLIPGVGHGKAGDLTEMALLTKEVGKVKRHIPIRQLLRRAGRSLLELKPCFMMGPLSVAQYLEQGTLQFDLVVMDEASQLRPEDALGAIARGKQLVVVGDPKQLPPTSFFDRLAEDDDDEPDEAPAVVEGAESILGICEHLYRPVRTLRWHYRSRHESLISFSNSQFYDHRLVVFPSPYQRNRRLGVNYRYVADGIYQDRRNIPEARRVVDAVVEHMLTNPDESLGVVTMNQTQRELIEDLLEQRLRSVAGVAKYLERHEQAGWPFFVKNLENVQGDERDVIFVSTTFGKPPGSTTVRQGFGPINRPDGWRRLNVLFTRARARIDLFTSLRPSDVRTEERASKGRKAFHDYLEFARSGALPPREVPKPTDRPEDSHFEIAVADALRARGYDCVPQVGVAGYFIDIAVRHPQRSTEFLAGIECDGVAYHSSLSARDRDRIRQEILESLGWRGRLIRIWSTDWFGNPAGQLERVVAFLKERAEQQDAAAPPPYTDVDVVESEPDDEQSSVESDALASMDGSSDPLDQKRPEVPLRPQPEIFIEVGDRVTYEAIGDPGELYEVMIADSPSNLKLGILNEQTPVAQALLGHCEGDEAELRVSGRPVRRLRVVKVVRTVAAISNVPTVPNAVESR